MLPDLFSHAARKPGRGTASLISRGESEKQKQARARLSSQMIRTLHQKCAGICTGIRTSTFEYKSRPLLAFQLLQSPGRCGAKQIHSLLREQPGIAIGCRVPSLLGNTEPPGTVRTGEIMIARHSEYMLSHDPVMNTMSTPSGLLPSHQPYRHLKIMQDTHFCARNSLLWSPA